MFVLMCARKHCSFLLPAGVLPRHPGPTNGKDEWWRPCVVRQLLLFGAPLRFSHRRPHRRLASGQVGPGLLSVRDKVGERVHAACALSVSLFPSLSFLYLLFVFSFLFSSTPCYLKARAVTTALPSTRQPRSGCIPSFLISKFESSPIYQRPPMLVIRILSCSALGLQVVISTILPLAALSASFTWLATTTHATARCCRFFSSLGTTSTATRMCLLR